MLMKLSSSTDRWHGRWMGLYLQLVSKDAPCVKRVEVRYDPFNTIRKMSKVELKDCGRMMAMYKYKGYDPERTGVGWLLAPTLT